MNLMEDRIGQDRPDRQHGYGGASLLRIQNGAYTTSVS